MEQAAELALQAVTAAAVLVELWALGSLARSALGTGRAGEAGGASEDSLSALPPPRQANPRALEELGA